MSKMIETDNNGDVRLGTKQIKQSGHKFISDKSCKERIKKLSAVNRASKRNEENYEMGCVVADREETFHSPPPSISGPPSKKFKLPRKQFFDDCDGVDHVSVPRKLRSAMKKRNGESISPPFPDSKKPNYSGGGVKSHKKVGIKRSKLNLKQGGPNWSLQQSNGPITKDEEEVVETLYALAGMFPDNNKIDSKSITGSESIDASASALTGPSDSHAHELEALKEDLNANCLLKTDEAVNIASDVERLPEETTKACSLNGPSIQEVSDFSSSGKLHQLDSSIAQVKSNKMFDIHEEQKSPGNSVNFCFPTEPHQDNGKVKQPVKLETSLLETKPEIALGLTTVFGQLDQKQIINEPKNNASWPSSSTLSSTSSHGPLSQSCAAKVPAWFGTRPGSFQNHSSTGNVSKVSTDQRSWKKCATHVHISRLIKTLQMPGTNESLELLPNKLEPQDILKQGVLMTINDFSSIKNDLNGVTSPSSIIKTTKTNLNDTKNGNLQHLRVQQDHSQADLASGVYTSQKQSFNFLSLSAGGGGMESNISNNRAANCSESLAKLQIPYHTQNPTLVPFSMYQTRGASAYPVHPSAAAVQQAQLQLPSHFSSTYCGPQANPKGLTKQQQLWAAQLTQYRNTGTSTAIMHFPSWKNGMQDSSPAMIPCIAPSPPTVEVLGPKYPYTTHHQQNQNQHQHHQQHQFVGFSLQHGRIKRQDHHPSSVYEETEVGFRASSSSALPIQLLCNEHL
ncbi:uncharacterized protein [Euphorbia lathyris]|uniref:uncharacterized protein isoform X2 n=1 Tax=Euphorbia lathyris TaxID=212925 RepID=UPI003314068A